MRIVARDASEVRVIGVMAATVEQAIRLKADVPNAAEVRHHGHGIHAAMARPAKFLRQFLGRQPHRIENVRICCIPGVHRSDVGRRRAVARFAGHAGNDAIEL